MQVTKNITLDLLETGSPVIIKAKQNDRNTRYIAAHLYVDGLAYPVPNGTEIAFRYKKPDGTAGFYDALPDNSPAITVSGNTVTVELVEQVLTAAGCVHCEINMYNATSEKLTTFTFEIAVEESVLTDAEIISSDYYNVLTAEITKALQAVTDATEQAENAAQSAQDAADSAAMSKDWAAGQPVTYSGAPVSIAYAGANRIASITAYGENAQGGTTEAPVALTGVDSAILFEQHTPINLAKPNEGESNGISIIANADGSVTARGTATKDTWPVLVRINIPSSIVSGDITISLSSPASVGMAFQSHSPSGKVEYVYLSAGYTSVTTKIKSGYTGMHIFLSLLPDQTIDETFHIMIAQGIEPVPFVPYVEPSVTPIPIPRPLRRVGDVKDKCVTRQKHEGAEKLVVTYNVGYIASYAGESITTAWISSTGALSTGAEVAYVLSSPETYATDPLDIDNAAGPLTVMTGGEVEVRMTELIGSRSPEFAGKMDRDIYFQVGNLNLGDNTNLLNPVNQQGQASYTGDSTSPYCIDRWRISNGTTYNIVSRTLTASSYANRACGMWQTNELAQQALAIGSTITFSGYINGMQHSGTIKILNRDLYSSFAEVPAGYECDDFEIVCCTASHEQSKYNLGIYPKKEAVLNWIKWEKGLYATPYAPKGFGLEQLECMRYYQTIKGIKYVLRKALASEGFPYVIPVTFMPMRAVPQTDITVTEGAENNLTATGVTQTACGIQFQPVAENVGLTFTLTLSANLYSGGKKS